MRQKTNGIHICLSALKTGLAVPDDEMIFMAKYYRKSCIYQGFYDDDHMQV